jgi:hypothetical protein
MAAKVGTAATQARLPSVRVDQYFDGMISSLIMWLPVILLAGKQPMVDDRTITGICAPAGAPACYPDLPALCTAQCARPSLWLPAWVASWWRSSACWLITWCMLSGVSLRAVQGTHLYTLSKARTVWLAHTVNVCLSYRMGECSRSSATLGF